METRKQAIYLSQLPFNVRGKKKIYFHDGNSTESRLIMWLELLKKREILNYVIRTFEKKRDS